VRFTLVWVLLLVSVACGGAQTQYAGSARRVIIKNGRLETVDAISFSHDSDALKTSCTTALDDVAAALRDMPQIKRVRIEGHADGSGDADYNMDLSTRRAVAVKKYLVDHGGIEAERLETRGHGHQEPVGDDATEGGRAANRRVELILVK
jgi:outer membrane protein OmpA-like peptidoglycan-associated protein